MLGGTGIDGFCSSTKGAGEIPLELHAKATRGDFFIHDV